MGIADWGYLNDGLDVASVSRGATAGVETPPGGGNFVFAYNSHTLAKGAVGLFVNMDNFAPMAKGGSIRGCIQRGPGGGPQGFSPFFFMCAQGPSVNDSAYLLGLSDDDPHRITLRKGAIVNGIPSGEGTGILLSSGENLLQGTWVHIRLDVIVNTNNDTILNVFQNDLVAHPLGTPPEWKSIPGMDSFIDDHLGISSLSLPFTSGWGGFGFSVSNVTRRAFFDHLEIARQL